MKERAFGLTGPQGNHGEDVKEYWWYLDALPSHAWNRWRYHYPQEAFPYQDLLDVNARRSRTEPEYELLDTGAFDGDRYWITEVHYAKAGPDDLLMTIQVTNAGPEDDSLHVLPTAWFRNTWAWDAGEARPGLSASAEAVGRDRAPDHRRDGADRRRPARRRRPQLLFCDNETNMARLYGSHPVTPLSQGRHQRPRGPRRAHRQPRAVPAPSARSGTGSPCRPGRPPSCGCGCARPITARSAAVALGAGFDQVMAERRAEADEFYAELTPAGASADEALVLRQACAGMLWSKQLFYYDVARWLDGDPAQPARRRARAGGTPSGATSTGSTSSPCRTSGSIPGSPPGTWPSTPSPWPTWTRRSPSTS